uniref:Ovarian-specific serine/threonine-protein kinase Lok n=1 Tax=Lygus hesperus TaxID=30085 RepID=A0A0A9XSM7_LYGHE
MGEVQAKLEEEEKLPDTLSPCESALSNLTRTGWGRLLPVNCSLTARELTEDIYTIGREPKCAVSITKYDVKPELYRQISKVQCRISRSQVNDDEYVVFLEDLSSNGTFVNRQKVGKGEKMVISSDDEISFALADFKVFVYIDSKDSSQWMPNSLSRKYHLIKHLGAGGFAEVKLVLDKKSCTKLAMKRLNKTGIEEKTIINEIQILRGLKHPCIVEWVDLDATNDDVFIIMEYVPDGNLLEKLQKDRRLSEPLSKLIFAQLVWAVRYMHEQRITHRDIKPENILISVKRDGLVVAKIADFGLAKIKDTMTHLKTACGTLHYTAPEVLSSRGEQEYTSKVDLWALGAVLYVCLTGRRPFAAKVDEPALLINLIMKGAYSKSTLEWKTLSPQAKLIIQRLLTVNPNLRYDCSDLFQTAWMKDPNLMNDLCTLFGSMNPFDEDTSERPTKIRRVFEV